MHKAILQCIMVSLLFCSCIPNAYSVPIVDIEMETDRGIYNVGDAITITGNVTLNGTPVDDALVAIEIETPNGFTYVIRTVPTGENASGGHWKVIILDLYACDSVGNPKDLFNKGSFVYINLTMENVDVLPHHVKAAIYIQCSDNTPLMAYYPFAGDMNGDQRISTIFSIPIPSYAPSGEAIIFASLFSDTPKNGGTAYCLEETDTFCIESTTPEAPQQPQYFNIIFKLPRTDVKLGNYEIYARSRYLTSLATEIISFNVVLLGDLYIDGKIDMRDIGTMASLYGTKEGDPDWNPNADIVEDGLINMRDIQAECGNYGKSAIY